MWLVMVLTLTVSPLPRTTAVANLVGMSAKPTARIVPAPAKPTLLPALPQTANKQYGRPRRPSSEPRPSPQPIIRGEASQEAIQIIEQE